MNITTQVVTDPMSAFIVSSNPSSPASNKESPRSRGSFGSPKRASSRRGTFGNPFNSPPQMELSPRRGSPRESIQTRESPPRNSPERPAIITSYGVACLRKNLTTNSYEMLMIKKRVTYAFLEFLRGRYDPTRPFELRHKFSGMTICEKILVKSRDFNTLWMYSWGRQPICTSERTMYTKSLAKFEAICAHDDGNLLVDLLNDSTNSNLVWECPKGRMNKREQPYDTAVREFEEETGLTNGDYTMLPDEGTVEYEFSDAGLRYRYVYYLAMMNHDRDVRYDFSNTHMITEVSAIQFMSVTAVQSIGDDRLHKVIRHVIKKLKRHYNPK